MEARAKSARLLVFARHETSLPSTLRSVEKKIETKLERFPILFGQCIFVARGRFYESILRVRSTRREEFAVEEVERNDEEY